MFTQAQPFMSTGSCTQELGFPAVKKMPEFTKLYGLRCRSCNLLSEVMSNSLWAKHMFKMTLLKSERIVIA